MTFVKICGITRLEDAQLAVECGADALGFNFYSQSPRFIAPGDARKIIAALPREVLIVGVFVNHPRDAIREIVGEAGLGAIQLHGDEPPDFCAGWEALTVIKALRIGSGAAEHDVAGYLTGARYLLLDRFESKEYGGTERSIADEALAPFLERADMDRVILAGGLTPANVAERIASYRPYGVDTASGVEISAGVKDPGLVKEFIRIAKNP